VSEDKVIIFCDGACSGNPGPGGWGVIVISRDHVIEFGGSEPQTTNNQMEILAATKALIYTLNKVENIPKKILIYTDSSYLISAITKWIYAWIQNNWVTAQGDPVKNVEYFTALLEVVNKLKPSEIEWVYVPGHSGVVGNERVDEIAVAFSKQLESDLQLFDGKLSDYPRSDVLESLPDNKKVPRADKIKESSINKKTLGYLAYINQTVYVFKTWDECARVTQGQPGAKYRKFSSSEEAISILKGWNVPDSKIKEVQHEI